MPTGNVPITAGSGTPIRVLSNTGVDSGAYQQIFTLAGDDGQFLTTDQVPQGSEEAVLTRNTPTKIMRTGFSLAISGGVDPDFGAVRVTGSGMAVNQTGGNLVITTGTTANSETIIRSNASFGGGVRLRARSTLSQRIANQQFFVELVDVIGDALAVTISSSTALTVTFSTNPFTSANVGQFMYLGAYSGSGTFVPGRYAIASVSGNTVTYTVSGMAAGSGTLSVFGWNYHHLIYSGTSATASLWDAQRRGWNSGDTTLAHNTTASPGHVAMLLHNDMQASVQDALVASNTAVQFTTRGSRVENVPDDVKLFVQIRVVNGSTAPASTTTWTMGHLAVGNFAPQDIAVQDIRPMGVGAALPSQIVGTPNVNLPNALPTGGNVIGAVGIGATSPTGTFTVSTGTNAAVVLKTSAASLQTLLITNTAASTQYVKLYNATSVTLGTTAAVLDLPVAAGATVALPLGPNGQRFGTGLALAITGAAGTTNNTANSTGVTVATTHV